MKEKKKKKKRLPWHGPGWSGRWWMSWQQGRPLGPQFGHLGKVKGYSVRYRGDRGGKLDEYKSNDRSRSRISRGLVRDVPPRGIEEIDATTRFDETFAPPKRGNEVKLWGKHNMAGETFSVPCKCKPRPG